MDVVICMISQSISCFPPHSPSFKYRYPHNARSCVDTYISEPSTTSVSVQKYYLHLE